MATSSRVEIEDRSFDTGIPRRFGDVLQHRLRANDLADRPRVRCEALDLTPTERGERLTEVDDRLGAPHGASREGESEADDGADEDTADRQPPPHFQALPGRREIDFLLVLQLRSRPTVRHAAATLSAAQRH